MTADEYYQQIIGGYDKSNVPLGETGAKQEAVAKFLSEYMFQSEETLIELARTDRNWFQEVYAQVRRYIARLRGKLPNNRELVKFERLFAKAAKASNKANTGATTAQKSPASESGVQYSLNILHSDGAVEVLPDARNLTEEQAAHYLELAKKGGLQRDTYIPVRKNTPKVLIDSLATIGETVDNRSLVMQVRKARGAMGHDGGNRAAKKHGSNVRKHGLSIPQILEILRNLDDPTTIVKQTNRKDKDGNPLPDNFAVFVEYKNGDAEGLAIVEFDASIDSRFIGKEYGDTQFHTVVTLLEPDTVRNGMPFDYLIDEVLSNPDNIEVKIVREHFTRSATGEIHPNTSSDLLSTYSIPDSSEKSNTQFSLPTTADSSLQVPSQGGDGGMGSTDTQESNTPRKPRLTKSRYIKRMLEDPMIGEATKERIRQDNPLYEVLSDKKRYERASELAVNEDAVLAIARKLENGETTTAEEITALTLVQTMSADGEAQAHAVYVTAMAAHRAGQTLRSLQGEKRNYAEMSPEERRAALIVDYKQDAGISLVKLQNEFIDHKYHKGAGDYLCKFTMRFESETGLADLTPDQLNERVLTILEETEDDKVKVPDPKSDKMIEAEKVNRIKGRIRYAFKSKEAGKCETLLFYLLSGNDNLREERKVKR